MEEMIDELVAYYLTMGFPMYDEVHLKAMSEKEIQDLYDVTFPHRNEESV